MKKYKMYIDESGGEHDSHPSHYYTLLGCIIEKQAQQELEIQANQIKYRYWKRTDVVFHSKEIALEINDFSIFKGNPNLKREFINDLLDLLRRAPIRISCCVVDKTKVYGYKVPWKHTTIIRKTTETVVLDFLRYIYSYAASGIIIHEASGFEKDANYLKSFNKVLTPAWEAKYPEFDKIREHLTSITFATKLNHDIECEMADILSYAARRKLENMHKVAALIRGTYDYKIVKVLEAKLLTPAVGLRLKKGKYDYMGSVVGFCTLP